MVYITNMKLLWLKRTICWVYHYQVSIDSFNLNHQSFQNCLFENNEKQKDFKLDWKGKALNWTRNNASCNWNSTPRGYWWVPTCFELFTYVKTLSNVLRRVLEKRQLEGFRSLKRVQHTTCVKIHIVWLRVCGCGLYIFYFLFALF